MGSKEWSETTERLSALETRVKSAAEKLEAFHKSEEGKAAAALYETAVRLKLSDRILVLFEVPGHNPDNTTEKQDTVYGWEPGKFRKYFLLHRVNKADFQHTIDSISTIHLVTSAVSEAHLQPEDVEPILYQRIDGLNKWVKHMTRRFHPETSDTPPS